VNCYRITVDRASLKYPRTMTVATATNQKDNIQNDASVPPTQIKVVEPSPLPAIPPASVFSYQSR